MDRLYSLIFPALLLHHLNWSVRNGTGAVQTLSLFKNIFDNNEKISLNRIECTLCQYKDLYVSDRYIATVW